MDMQFIIVDTPMVFSCLKDDYGEPLSAVCERQIVPDYKAKSETCGPLESVEEIDEVLKKFLNSVLEGPELTQEEMTKVLELLKAGHFNKCKINGVIQKSKLELVEICSLDFDPDMLNTVLQGPDFPKNQNKNSSPSPLQTFELKMVLPSNILETFIVYHLLKTKFKLEDHQFILHHKLEPFVKDALKTDYKFETLENGVLPSIWLTFGDARRVSSLLESYPALKHTSVSYKYVIKKPNEVLKDGEMLVKLGIEHGISKLENLRSKIQNIARIKDKIDELKISKPELTDSEAQMIVRSQMIKIGHNLRESANNYFRTKAFVEEFPF